jgi:hypothetical protein
MVNSGFTNVITGRHVLVEAEKYADLVKPLKFIPGRGGANARELVFVGGEELGGFDLNFIIGVYDQTGDWAPGMGAHSHTFDECLLFFGYDDNDLNYLGSEISLAVGKEQEVHRFGVPTVVAAPRGMPHCPLITEKVYNRFGHFHLALDAKYSGDRVEKEGETDGNKYTHLFHEMQAEPGPGGAGAVQLISVEGDDLAGLNINFKMGLYKETGQWHPGKSSCVHPYDEVLVFFGHDTGNLGYLGADITIDIGEEHEKHSFGVPTVVSIPRGTPHCPIVCNKVERPYGMMQIGLAARYDCSWLD